MRGRRLIPGSAVALASVLGLASPAWAGPLVTDSTGFAGYQATVPTGSATTSQASFKVPALSCGSAYQGITPVAGVEENSYATYSSAFVFVGCQNGAAQYFPALVVNGTETNYTSTALSAGDAIKLYASVSATAVKVKVTDVTKGITEKLIGSGASADAAYVGDSDWVSGGTLLGVPNFGKLRFTGCKVDGMTLASWSPTQYRRVSGSTVQIATGALSSTGTAFTTSFKHS